MVSRAAGRGAAKDAFTELQGLATAAEREASNIVSRSAKILGRPGKTKLKTLEMQEHGTGLGNVSAFVR